ncbi:hypothetical protein TNIN_469161 [Trichonephila inaurata madagascariensis]|uniref:Uncharacterized protein n=1 Tax=Trichonephila inaurata madagascariensis TaxID=2747483 RepID=A0A8X7CD45_9ARAC|nr:hypothetical protein TNIN_469161 [Trichonephila inaurata madagascariensis]
MSQGHTAQSTRILAEVISAGRSTTNPIIFSPVARTRLVKYAIIAGTDQLAWDLVIDHEILDSGMRFKIESDNILLASLFGYDLWRM